MAGPRFWALIPSSWLPDQPCCLHILLVHINTEHTSLRPHLWTHSFLWPQPSHVPHDCPGAEHQTSLQRHVAEHLSGISCCGQFPEGARSSAESNSLLPTVQSAAVQGHTWPSTNHFRSPSHSHFGVPGAAEWRWRESCPPARLLDTFLSTALFHLCLLDKPLLSKLLAVQPLAQCIHSPVFSVTPTSGSLLPLTVGPPHTLSRDRVLFPSFPHLTLWGTPLALWVSLCPVPGEYPFLPHPAHVWHLPDTLALMIKGLTKKLGTRARKMGGKHPINYKVIKWPLDSSKN